MPIAFLQNPGSLASVEIWKFGLYLWCEEQLRVNFVLIFNNQSPQAHFDNLRIVFPYVLENVEDNSHLLGDKNYPLNNFKFGPYNKGTGNKSIELYDGIPNVKILETAIEPTITKSKEAEWSLLNLTLKPPLEAGETGGLLLSFQLSPSTTNETVIAPHGLTFSKTKISLNFSIRIFDKYLMASAADVPQIRDNEIIKARVLYDKGKRHGGFDINLFVPTSYIDAKTSPEAEYLDVITYDWKGKPSREKFTRFVWRARRLYEDHQYVQCGDRMVLSGVFLNPNEVLSQLQTVSGGLKREIMEVKTLSENLQKAIEKVDWWAKVAIGISILGLLALVVEYDKIVSFVGDLYTMVKSWF